MSKRPPNAIVSLPSGIEVEFYDETGVDGQPQQRRYCIDGEKLVSVSTVANVYDKPALVPWAAKQAQMGLDWRKVRDDAAERGKAAHDALVALLADQKLPNPADFPAEQRGYIQAGAKWVLDEEPEIIEAEQIVVSTEHGFAGRFDLLAKFPARDNRIGRIDFKTVTEWHYRKKSDGTPTDELLPPYPEHLSQVEGYEIAAVESGRDDSDFRAVVRLGPDGSYDMTESWARADHFLGDLAAYRNRQDLNQCGSRARREAKKQREREEVAA